MRLKTLLFSVAETVVKLRSMVTHCRHHLQVALKRVARALALLVTEARGIVLQRRPGHLPMWKLQAGSAEWLKRGISTKGWWDCEEYDGADCFMNPPREAVQEAMGYWLLTTQRCSRRQQYIAISKDGKAGDHRGRPSSIHYWKACRLVGTTPLPRWSWSLCRGSLLLSRG